MVAAVALGVCAMSAMLPAAQDADAKAKYQAALAYLTKIEPELDPEVRQFVPALKAALERYYLNKADLLLSEKQLVETFLEEMKDPENAPKKGTLISRGRGDKLPKLSMLLKSKPADAAPPVEPKKPTTPPTKPANTAPKKPVAKPTYKLPGVTTRPVFTSTVRTVAGRKVGAVTASLEGRKQTLVEVLSDVGQMTIAKRAEIVASRLKDLQTKDPLWWMHIQAGRMNNQIVVKAPKAPQGWLVTADPAWASECGMTQDQLARMIVKNIRNAFDDRPGSLIHRGDPTPEELRTLSVRLRMQGDELFESKPAEAETKYKQAIATDPSHLTPYLRLADLLIANGKKDEAVEALQSALKAPLQDTEKAQIEKKLASL